MNPEEVMQKYEKYINPSSTRLFRFMGLSSVEARAEGWIITDTEGTEFIDCLGGFGMFAVGHKHPKVVEAVERELHNMPMCGKVLFNEPAAKLAEKLAEITPGGLQYNFFCNSGTEAVEGCLKVARLATGRKKFVAAHNAFHGKTFGSLTATGRDMYRDPFKPLLEGFTHVPFNDITALEAAVDEDTAAVILEPVQGEGGINVPADGYMKQAEEIAHKKGALLIADEVQTGIGRTGTWFGVEHDGAKPDLMAVAKALGGGIMPIGSVIGTEAAWNLLQRSAETGAYFKKGIEAIAKDFPQVIKEVRGRGMMIGMDLTKEGAGGMLMALMIDQHIVVAYTLNNPKVIRIEPPLTMPKSVVDHVLEVLRNCIKQVAEAINDL